MLTTHPFKGDWVVNEPNSINVLVWIEMYEKLYQFLQSSIRFIPRNKTDKFISTGPSKVQVVFRPSTCPRLQSRPVCVSEPIHWLQFINYSYQLYKQNQTHISMKKNILGPTCIMKKSIQNQTLSPINSRIYCFWQWSHMYHQFKIFIHETLISIRNDSL